MATKEDVLEQIVEEYLIHEGYFVRHNVKFLPNKDHRDYASGKDSNHSDIDVVGIHPLKTGPDRVLAVSCKSWQDGFNTSSLLDAIVNEKKISGRPAWKSFRELTTDKWSEGFVNTVMSITGAQEFTYVLAVTRIKGDRKLWEENNKFRSAMKGNPVRLLPLREMMEKVGNGLGTTVASSEIGRLLQILRAARLQS